MARLNRTRSIQGEANLAQRVARERRQRHLSYEALAKQMTDAGCSIQGSAIYKIEKADPPRRITVDELVAFARVFETTVEDLLTPVEVLDQERAKQLLKDLDDGDELLFQATSKIVQAYADLFELAAFKSELFEYVTNHRFRARGNDHDEEPLWQVNIDGTDTGVDDRIMREAVTQYEEQLLAQAEVIARTVVQHVKERSRGQH